MPHSDVIAKLRPQLAELAQRTRVFGPATHADLVSAERRLGRPLPRGLQEVLAVTMGFEGSLPLGIAGQCGHIGLDELYPHALHLLDDGFGNSFIYDVGGDDADPARVLFACHDPPAVVFVTASIAEFVVWAALSELNMPGPLSQLDEWLGSFSKAGPGAIVERGAVRTLNSNQRGSTILTRQSSPGDGFWWAASNSALAARRTGEAPTFELWRE